MTRSTKHNLQTLYRVAEVLGLLVKMPHTHWMDAVHVRAQFPHSFLSCTSQFHLPLRSIFPLFGAAFMQEMKNKWPDAEVLKLSLDRRILRHWFFDPRLRTAAEEDDCRQGEVLHFNSPHAILLPMNARTFIWLHARWSKLSKKDIIWQLWER